MKKLLIIGASGLTGFKLAKLAVGNYEVYGTYNKRAINIENCQTFQLDKTILKETKSLIDDIKPDIIVDCSALHNVDYCEKNQEETYNVNVKAPSYIAESCKKIGARMVYISTDYVFDGSDNTYDEESKTNPLNYYGISKLKAEEEISKSGISYVIARTSLVFGWNPGEILGQKSSSGKSMNFVIWALKKLRNNEGLKMVTDQYSTPTYADNLAEYLLALAHSNHNGIFNTVGAECLNRYDFTLKIAKVFEFDKNLITPVTSGMFKQVAKRPMRCCLKTKKLETLIKVKPLTVEEALNRMKAEEEEY